MNRRGRGRRKTQGRGPWEQKMTQNGRAVNTETGLATGPEAYKKEREKSEHPIATTYVG